MSEPDVVRAFEDQKFISDVENALTNDLRQAGLFVDILWHLQSKDYYIFRFEADPNLVTEADIIEAFAKPGTESEALGVSKPYKLDDRLVVYVKRPTPGPLYDQNGDQYA